MRLLFITGLYPAQIIKKLREESNGDIGNAANVFQWNVVKGLWQNDADFDVVSLPFIPAFPMRFKKLFVPRSPICIEGCIVGTSLRYCDLAVWKTFSMRQELKKYIFNWIREFDTERDLVILTYTPYVPFIKAIQKVKNRYPNKNIKVVSIVTDLVDDMMHFSANQQPLKRIQSAIEKRETKRLYKLIDKFVLLSKYMVDKIPEAKDRYMVMEGIAECGMPIEKADSSDIKTLLYTGTLQEFAGVTDLVAAFKKTKSPNFRLVICGAGGLQNMVMLASQEDPRIIYKGLVSREVAVTLQYNSTLLINPRKPNNDITKYSFPSKTMEYLSSGTPMLGYKLDGIPKEYYEHYYTIDELDVDSLTRRIQEVLSMPERELKKKAADARRFVMQNKTAKAQIRKMLDFINL